MVSEQGENKGFKESCGHLNGPREITETPNDTGGGIQKVTGSEWKQRFIHIPQTSQGERAQDGTGPASESAPQACADHISRTAETFSLAVTFAPSSLRSRVHSNAADVSRAASEPRSPGASEPRSPGADSRPGHAKPARSTRATQPTQTLDLVTPLTFPIRRSLAVPPDTACMCEMLFLSFSTPFWYATFHLFSF